MNSLTVEVILKGGLGNQLFQFTAAAKIAEERGCRIVLNTSNLAYKRNNIVSREFELGQFKKLPKYELITQTKRWIKIVSSMKSDYLLGKFGIVTNFENSYINARKTRVLDGYFQSKEPALVLADRLRNWLKLDNMSTSRIDEVLRDINVENSAVVHVRLGDYLKLPEFPIMKSRYLEEAISRELEVAKNTIAIYAVTDSPLELRSLYGEILKKFDIKILNTNDLKSANLLHLIARFKALILSKSSLGWWAAFLAKNEYTRVYVPFSDNPVIRGCFSNNLVLNDWVKIDAIE